MLRLLQPMIKSQEQHVDMSVTACDAGLDGGIDVSRYKIQHSLTIVFQ